MATGITQLSVFIENRAGRAQQITQVLTDAGVSVRGFMISDTLDYGIVRLVVDRPQEGLEALKKAGATVKTNQILVARLADKPGVLNQLFNELASAGVNMVYSYSLVSTFVAIMVEDIDAACKLIAGSEIELISQEELADKDFAAII